MMEESEGSEENVEEEETEVELDPNNPEHEFPILERNFNKTIADIEQNPNACQYSDDLYQLFEYLYKIHENEKNLEEKVMFLENELENKNNQLEIANKITEVDRSTINELKNEIEHSWKLTDDAHSREQNAQEIIDNLRKQIEALNVEIEFKNKMGQDSSEDLGQVSKHQEGLERERDRLLGEVTQLTQKLHNSLGYQDELERKNSAADLRITQINLELEDHVNEIERHKRAYSKLETDLNDLTYQIEEKDTQIQNLNTVISSHLKNIHRLENQLKESKIVNENVLKEFETIEGKHTKLLDENTNTTTNLNELKKEIHQKNIDLKSAKEESNHLKNDLGKVTKTKDMIDKRLKTLEGDKYELITERDKLRQRVVNFEKEIDLIKKQNDSEKRVMETIEKEKEILNKTIIKQETVNKEQLKLIKIHERGKKKLENELDLLNAENNKQMKLLNTLSRDKERLSEEQLNLNRKIEDALDDVRLKKNEIYELTKNLNENETKLRMQQNLFDVIRAERNAFQKSLQESTAEAGELKKKVKITNHQIEQLKEDISMKERLLVKEENIFRKVLKDKENLKIELDGAKEQIKHLKLDINEKEAEEKRLHKEIMENEKLIKEQSTDLEQLMNERDILGSQLVRRNDEIALLHEKILILQTTLQQGESQYQQRLQDIKLLKLEIKRLRQEKNLLNKSIANSIDYRLEIFHLERDLTKVRLKCRALEDELQNPLNVHRWRKLEGSDPNLLELLQKIQLLQKRLVRQSSEAVERERQLKETERLYLNLKQVLEKQPGPGLQQELIKTQKALKTRGEKLKCLVSELNMSELKSTEYKSDLQKVTDELNQLKKKFFNERRLNQKKISLDTNQLNATSQGQMARFTGGGYRMSATTNQSFVTNY